MTAPPRGLARVTPSQVCVQARVSFPVQDGPRVTSLPTVSSFLRTHPCAVAVGACACGGGVLQGSYCTAGGVPNVLPVDIFVPGCPPRPQALIHGLLVALDRLEPRLQGSAATPIMAGSEY